MEVDSETSPIVGSPASSDTEAGAVADTSEPPPALTAEDLAAEAAQREATELKRQENEHAKSMLQRPDAIFEPDCFLHLKKYISTGGSPVTVIQMLEAAYIGYPQMCNLVCHWLKLAGVSDEEIQSIAYEYVKKSVLEKFDVAKTDAMFQQFQVRARGISF